MSYQQYGISQELVEEVKKKMKDPQIKEHVKSIMEGVTKADLQSRIKLKKLMLQVSKATGVKVGANQAEKIISFVIEKKIDPNNTFHLIKLWGMFR